MTASAAPQLEDAADTLSTCKPALDEDGSETLIPIALETLRPRAALDFDLYLWANAKSSAVRYRERGAPFTRGDIDRLVEADIRSLYVELSDHMGYRRYLRQEVIGNRVVPPVQQFRILKELNRKVFESVLRGRNVGRLVEFTDAYATDLMSTLCDRACVLADLFSLMDHDYYTYSHATNVCVYCLALSDGLGISSEADLAAIATAALLHDFGKRKIPAAILNKPGKLDAEEWDLVQEHPRTAFDELAPRGDLNWDQLMLIYQHHERLDGSGYPVGLEGAEIHEWARICAIADVFDALTSERPYRQPDSVGKARDYLGRMAGRAFDGEMVKCWLAMTKRCG
jgi:HD-GYP domain-containing protein (c-di-GMP phosphodiesterase class II)